MKILVIIGNCLMVNSSANLCHIKYIEGMVSLGHTVDLLTVSEVGLITDRYMKMPLVNRTVKYRDSYYKRIGARRPRAVKLTNKNKVDCKEKSSLLTILKRKIKVLIRNAYGVYGADVGWILRASTFKEKETYDLVVSIAYPPSSHRLAEILILANRIKTRRWIQIWEDPWFSDLNNSDPSEKVKKEEERLVSAADVVYYVSPLTLFYQTQLFPKAASKMRWQPLPAYYMDQKTKLNFEELKFGYFGDYHESVRNLSVFYEYAVVNELNFTICGNSNRPLSSVGNVTVFPRMPLDKLKPIEENVNVLVFVCNLGGGQIPGKIYQYSATNKYILFIMDGNEYEKAILREYFNQFNRYVFCENTMDSIEIAIKKIRDNVYPESYYTALDYFATDRIVNRIIQGE